jgi:hypothetical protein
VSSDRWQTVTQAPVAERGVRSRLGKESAPMPFFRCFCVDKSITPYFRISSPTISKSPPKACRAQWAQKSGRWNRIAPDAAQGRQDRRDRDET